jgi:hypothetical protein
MVWPCTAHAEDVAALVLSNTSTTGSVHGVLWQSCHGLACMQPKYEPSYRAFSMYFNLIYQLVST